MQRVGNLFEKLISYDNLLLAFLKAKKGTKTGETKKFEFNLERELLKLKEELISEKYKPTKYKYFILKEPKEREVSVATFKDRVVHHSIVNILEPIFEKTFIFDSYANRKNKGLLKGIKKLQKMIKTNREYYLKADIEKFFDNIDYEIMLNLIERKIKDKKIIKLIKIVLKNDISKTKGLPIGNLTSQFFANIYLTGLDHFIKEKLKVKKYVRYMDDFVIIEDDIEKIKNFKEEIEKYLENNLELKLKKSATYVNKVDNGISFCGVRIFKNLIRVRRESLKYSLLKIKNKLKLFEKNKTSEDKLYETLNSIFSYWKNYDTYKLRLDLLKKLNI